MRPVVVVDVVVDDDVVDDVVVVVVGEIGGVVRTGNCLPWRGAAGEMLRVGGNLYEVSTGSKFLYFLLDWVT